MTRLAVLSLIVAGCVRPDLPTCGDLTCPPGTRCVGDLEICASQGAIDACSGSASGTLCSVGDVDGSCELSSTVGEVCVGEVCGDGEVTGREQCDSGIGAAKCTDFGYYFGDLACSSSCLYDFGGCSGKCGDNMVQSPIEDCDGRLPDYTCVGRGFDYGHLQCTAHCTDSSLTDCGDLTAKTLLGAMLGTSGAQFDSVFMTPSISVFASSAGLTVFDQGVESDFTGVGAIHALIGANDIIYISNGNNVDELAGDPQNLTLKPLAASAPFLPGNAVYGLAIDSHGTVYAVAADCEWATFDGTQWTLQPNAVPSVAGMCTAPRAIVVSASDEVYAVDASGKVSYLTGTTWAMVNGAPNGRLNPAGPDNHALVVGAASGTSSGIYELVGNQASAFKVDVPAQNWPQTWTDAVAIKHPGTSPPTYEYIALFATAAWWLSPKAPPIVLGSWHDIGTELGIMPDGHVVAWGDSVNLLTPITASVVGLDGGVAIPNAGLAAYGTSFIGWTSSMATDEVVDVVVGGTPYFLAAASDHIVDVDVSGSDIYVATGSAIYRSTGPGMQSAPLCSWSNSESPIAIAGTGGINGYVATFDTATLKTALYQFAGTATAATCSPVNGLTGKIAGLATSPTGELYAAVVGGSQVGVEHLNTQTNTWEALHAVNDFLVHDLEVLPDGTIVLCAQDHISIGTTSNGTLTWQDIGTGARHASGTSATDIWFTGAVARASVMASLAQWNGTDLAPVNEVTTNMSAYVAATSDVVMLANTNDIYALVRFAIP